MGKILEASRKRKTDVLYSWEQCSRALSLGQANSLSEQQWKLERIWNAEVSENHHVNMDPTHSKIILQE